MCSPGPSRDHNAFDIHDMRTGGVSGTNALCMYIITPYEQHLFASP